MATISLRGTTSPAQLSRIITHTEQLSPDPFVLITKSSAQEVSSPGSPSDSGLDRRTPGWTLLRAYPLVLFALADAAWTSYLVISSKQRSLPNAAVAQLQDVAVIAYVRSLVVLLVGWSIGWRRKVAWVLSTSVGTACLAAWEADWLVLSRHGEEIGRGSFWLKVLASVRIDIPVSPGLRR